MIRLLDTSAWLAYFFEVGKANRQVLQLVESEETLLTAAVTFLEFKRKLLKRNATKEDIERAIEFIKHRSLVISIDASISEKAAVISFENNLGAIDALIYTSAETNNATLVTCDSDFKHQHKLSKLVSESSPAGDAHLPNVELL